MKTIALTEKMSAAEFLAFERAADTKHEFINGQIIDMAGGSGTHLRIIGNLYFFLRLNAVNDLVSFMGSSEMRVYNPFTEGYYYPDVFVTTETPVYQDDLREDVLLNPSVIVEVLSPSTERIDRTEKYWAYTNLASLKAYILVAQSQIKVELFQKNADGDWYCSVYTRLTDVIDLSFSTITLAEIYKNIHL